MTTTRDILRVEEALRETFHWPGSPRLRAGLGFIRARVPASWIGTIGVEQAFRTPTGQILSVDLVISAVTLHVGTPPKIR